MRKWILLILALLPVCGVWSQVVFKNDEVTVSLLKDKTWVFETWDYTTMYLLEGTGRAALIDAGTRCADLDQIVERITDKPYDVIITHAHPDHAGCIGYFDEVWMHRNDSVLIAERTKDYKGTVRYLHEGQVFTWAAGSWKWLSCRAIRPDRWCCWTMRRATATRATPSARARCGCNASRCCRWRRSTSPAAAWSSSCRRRASAASGAGTIPT